MATNPKIGAIHNLIGTRIGYGYDMLTSELESRTPTEIDAVYHTIRAYSEDIDRLNSGEIIHLTDKLILGLRHVSNKNPRDLSTYIEVSCFGEPLEPEHIEHVEHRRITTERKFNGAKNLAYIDGTDPEEDS